MDLTCPSCSAHYTISAERLDGRRAKARCKRCGESFPVDASQQSGEVYARRAESRRGRDADLFAGAATAGSEEASHATPLTGERNESSVLFSLAALSKHAAEPRAAQAATVTESSSLIDIRALMSSAPKEDPSTQRADDIMNLGGGGAFAPLFASPLAPPVTFAPPENEAAARRSSGPMVVGAIAFAVVAMVSVAAFVGVRSQPSATAAAAMTAATQVSAPADAPSAGNVPSTSTTSTVVPPETPAPSSTQPVVAAPARTTKTSNVAPPARSAAEVPTASPPATPSKCCPGESEMACQMRVAAGASCGVEATTSAPATSVAPFDRPAAARALAINVSSCKRADGPTGPGHVKVTFQPTGSTSAVEVEAPYAGTSTGACIAQRFRGASVPAFAGGPLTVGKTIAIE